MSRIALFAYDFPHRKTQDFLTALYLKGFEDVAVICAPKIKLSHEKIKNPKRFQIEMGSEVLDTSILCEKFKFNYHQVKHNDAKQIKVLVEQFNINTAIVSGARIIGKDVISLFSNGIINFHPGKIPETSGLDSFYWMIRKNSLPGITIHYIDHKVDAGLLISFDEVTLNSLDSISSLQAKLYQQQIRSLYNLLSCEIKSSNECTTLQRPKKNLPMCYEDKCSTLLQFEDWKQTIITRQLNKKIFTACETGNLKYLKQVKNLENFINITNEKHWSPLVVAAYNNHYEVVKWLVENGADINHCATKGTSVLMYAKKSQLNKSKKNYLLLDYLIENGANINHVDIFGKNIIDYCFESGDNILSEYFNKKRS